MLFLSSSITPQQIIPSPPYNHRPVSLVLLTALLVLIVVVARSVKVGISWMILGFVDCAELLVMSVWLRGSV